MPLISAENAVATSSAVVANEKVDAEVIDNRLPKKMVNSRGFRIMHYTAQAVTLYVDAKSAGSCLRPRRGSGIYSANYAAYHSRFGENEGAREIMQ